MNLFKICECANPNSQAEVVRLRCQVRLVSEGHRYACSRRECSWQTLLALFNLRRKHEFFDLIACSIRLLLHHYRILHRLKIVSWKSSLMLLRKLLLMNVRIHSSSTSKDTYLAQSSSETSTRVARAKHCTGGWWFWRYHTLVRHHLDPRSTE